MTSILNVMVSRFPDSLTPGALPLLPDAVTIHERRGGGYILYRWYDNGEGFFDQSPPEFHDTLAGAWLRVPADLVRVWCPSDFARFAYRKRRVDE